jgi:hypothetical protein
VLPTEPFLLLRVIILSSVKNITKVHSMHDFETEALLAYYTYEGKYYEVVACQEPTEEPAQEPIEEFIGAQDV